jgi:hypothetical protein
MSASPYRPGDLAFPDDFKPTPEELDFEIATTFLDNNTNNADETGWAAGGEKCPGVGTGMIGYISAFKIALTGRLKDDFTISYTANMRENHFNSWDPNTPYNVPHGGFSGQRGEWCGERRVFDDQSPRRNLWINEYSIQCVPSDASA